MTRSTFCARIVILWDLACDPICVFSGGLHSPLPSLSSFSQNLSTLRRSQIPRLHRQIFNNYWGSFLHSSANHQHQCASTVCAISSYTPPHSLIRMCAHLPRFACADIRMRYQNRTLALPICAAPGAHLKGNPEFCTLAAFASRVRELAPASEAEWKCECALRPEDIAPAVVAATTVAPAAVVPSERAPANGAKTKVASVAAQNKYERIEWCG